MDIDETFPKNVRLLRQPEFDAVFRHGDFAADQILVIHAATNGMGKTRLGLAVGRKVGNAVVRNRWKRAIRESFRRQRWQLPVGLDLVVRPRKGGTCSCKGVSLSLEKLTDRLANKLKLQRTNSDGASVSRLDDSDGQQESS